MGFAGKYSWRACGIGLALTLRSSFFLRALCLDIFLLSVITLWWAPASMDEQNSAQDACRNVSIAVILVLDSLYTCGTGYFK